MSPQMDFNCHRVTQNDLADVWQLFQALRQEGALMSFADYEHITEILDWPHSSEHLVYVARDEQNRLSAVVRGKREDTPEKRHAVFLTAATASHARGLGLAKILTEYALEQMVQEGVQLARIYVYSDNLPSIRAVSKLGFTQAGKVLHHHYNVKTSEFIDDLIFHKLLV